jgi:hypothetical protein
LVAEDVLKTLKRTMGNGNLMGDETRESSVMGLLMPQLLGDWRVPLHPKGGFPEESGKRRKGE